MADHLPPEVLVDVFIKLPVKSILICTSVCKSWRSFIVNPSFINLHLNRPRTITYNNAQDLLVVRTCSEMTEEELYSLRCDNEAFAEYAKLDFPFDRAVSGYYRIVGSCDGVLCLTDDQWTYMDSTILWNPTIRKWVRLPRPRVTFRSHGGFGHAFGFGFDAKSNDYKVVRIVYLDSGYRVPPEVDVYALSTGTWRNISYLLLPYHIAERATQVYLNGASHWIGWDLKRTHGVVVSFDMVNEVFNYINLPAGVEFGFASPHYPAVIQGSLSLVERIGSGDEQVYSIWVMKEYGVASSWTKQLHIGIGSSIGRLIGFRKKGELLFAARGDIICFNPESAKVRVLGIRSKTVDWNSYSGYADSYIDSYVESLVLLGIAVHIEESEDESEEEDNKVVAGLQSQIEENEEEEMKLDGSKNEPGSDEEQE